jgi:hypothetical protein
LITRRNVLTSASAALIHSPLVVRAINLMPLRGIILPPEKLYFGFCERLSVHLHLPKITQNEGFSLHQIATELNRRGPKPWIDRPWDPQFVTGILKLDERIKHADEYLRV